jgi:hypothetical protein
VSRPVRTDSLTVIREAALLDRFGELMSSRQASEALQFSSVQALRKAHKRGMVPFSLFRLPGRRGLFVSTRDVARFLDHVISSHSAPQPALSNASEG